MRIFLLSTMAIAVSGCRSATPHFDAADANDNGHVTLGEWQRHIVTTLHTENDENHDGRVTFAEWLTQNPGADRSRFLKLDRDGDGAIGWTEGLKFVQDEKLYDQSFRAMDTDENGTLERKEALRYRDAMVGWGL